MKISGGGGGGGNNEDVDEDDSNVVVVFRTPPDPVFVELCDPPFDSVGCAAIVGRGKADRSGALREFGIRIRRRIRSGLCWWGPEMPTGRPNRSEGRSAE